jgi:hypothetical protein
MELNVNGIMARIPVLSVVDYGLEFEVLKRLVRFFAFAVLLKMNRDLLHILIS